VTPRLVENATCTFCGCLCDDIELHTDGERIVRARRACTLGRAWFCGYGDDGRPATLVDGRPASMDEAIDRAADILRRADLPLVYGLGNSTTESQNVSMTS